MKEQTIKATFVNMCSSIDVFKGNLFFNFDEFEHTLENRSIVESKDYPVLKEKMQNLITIISEDNSLIELDIEEELWFMI